MTTRWIAEPSGDEVGNNGECDECGESECNAEYLVGGEHDEW